jgi:hypothetical protein
MPSSSVIEIVAFLLAGCGGLFLLIQNYRYWRTYGGNDLLLWVVGGALAVFLAAWVLITRLLVPATLDSHVLGLLTLSRRLLIAVVFFLLPRYRLSRIRLAEVTDPPHPSPPC